ncbi:MAG: helix-turn-helix domain-containing protein [Pseudonocardiaceae bacterium]
MSREAKLPVRVRHVAGPEPIPVMAEREVRSVDETAPDGAVGHRVTVARKLAGLTQQQLATRAHVSKSLVCQVERGVAPASVAFTTTTAAARALGVDVDALTGDLTARRSPTRELSTPESPQAPAPTGSASQPDRVGMACRGPRRARRAGPGTPGGRRRPRKGEGGWVHE